MPWLIVNQTRLSARAAVPTALLALEVQRGGMPGDPGGTAKSVKSSTSLLLTPTLRQLYEAGLARSNHNSPALGMIENSTAL